jgi:uncharacterized Tic20 family protein
MWSHLATLLIGLGGALLTAGLLSVFCFVFPLVVMNVYGGRSPWVRAHAAEELNFQLSQLLFGLILLVGGLFLAVITLGIALLVLIPLWLGWLIWWVVVMIIATTRASNGDFYRYPLTIRFVK